MVTSARFLHICVAAVAVSGCWFTASETALTDQPLVIDANWKTLKVKRPLRKVKGWQHVVVEPSGDFGKNPLGQPILKTGERIEPEAELQDAAGRTYTLKSLTWFKGNGKTLIGVTGDFPADGAFVAVRIRSNVPFTAARVLWRGTNPF